MTGIRISQVRPQAENLSILPIKPMDLYIVSLMLLLGSQHRPPNGLRRGWASDFRQLSWDLPVCFLTTKALYYFKWVCFSLYYRIPVSHSALWGANGQATGYMICMKWDEWVGELVCGHLCSYPKPTLWLAYWRSLSTRARMIQMFEDHKWPTWLC